MVEYKLNIEKEEIDVMPEVPMLENKKKRYISEWIFPYILVLVYSFLISAVYISDMEQVFFLCLFVTTLFFVILRIKRSWLTIWQWITISLFTLTTCYIGVVQYGMFLAVGDSFRVWFRWDIPVISVLVMQLFLIIWTIIVSCEMKKTYPVICNVLVWVVGVLMYLLLGVALLATIIQGDGWNEIDNGDGTLIVEEQMWLEEPEYYLFQKKNLFVITYLRNASSYDDIDTSITQEEYERMEQAKEDALYASYQDATELSEDEMEEYSQEEPIYAYESAGVQAGYEKIYQECIETSDTIYQEGYNAKGYTRIVVYEDSSIIKYLVYDGYFENNSYIRYVYYQNEKDEDGSWSPVDAEILNMYYYILETEEVEDTGKTSW
ncbi:MAG: hypothetical protein R3Y58_03945 [Eubacteriales bacterium]